MSQDGESTADGDSDLDRTIGFAGALTIGTGTMIGAGIFVFPGLAAGEAGASASISFGIGAIVALLVALPTSELATAMPKSGGGYYFISRGFGAIAGSIVGISLTFGLIFASAFYLVGLGEYAAGIFVEVGVIADDDFSIGPLRVALVLGVIVGILLTVTSMFGTENTEALQNIVVGLLLAILAFFLSVSGLDVIGVVGESRSPGTFVPDEQEVIFTTAALVFTSYLGFAQIATVAEDIVDPGRNLPRSMIGSVVLVAILYAVTVYIAASTFEPSVLLDFGETATVEVAREYLGLPGAIVILFAGLLATFSSANASILSASRSLYALSADSIVPEKAAVINRKYGTPHFALGFVGGLAVLLTAYGQTEILAEVASFLHLIMYGLICFVLIAIRRRDPDWYAPSFHCPGYPIVPIIGGIASFALIPFMETLSIVLGTVVAIVSLAWYFLYARDVKLKDELE